MVLREAETAIVTSVSGPRGARALSGYFRSDGAFGWDVNYMLDPERCDYLWRHDALKDFDTGIVFSKIDLVCNCTPVDQIVPALARLAQDPDNAEVFDVFTHEQYFWDFYCNYIPDHAQRLDAALRWLTENGHAPVFFHEGLLGGEA